jgi:hypothetical protein
MVAARRGNRQRAAGSIDEIADDERREELDPEPAAVGPGDAGAKRRRSARQLERFGAAGRKIGLQKRAAAGNIADAHRNGAQTRIDLCGKEDARALRLALWDGQCVHSAPPGLSPFWMQLR